MPRFIVPRFHTPHRVAAIALYRALLRAAAPNPSAAPLQALIRHRFRHNIHLQSPRLLRIAFGSGYSLLDTLDSGSQPEIESYLSTAPATALLSKLANPPPAPVKRAPIFPAPDAELRSRPRPTADLRPRVHGTKPHRRIPTLFSANRFPVLRLDKPQPQNLSIYLTRLIQQRDRRWRKLREYEDLVETGRLEDRWDALIGNDGRGSWAVAGELAVKEVRGAMRKRDEASTARAEWYVKIVDQEKEMLEMERREKRRERNERAWGRKKSRDGWVEMGGE